MSTEVQGLLNMFFDSDGEPLDNGYLFIGEAGLNPLSNPKAAYWDAALTIPALDIRIVAGRPVYNGAVGHVYVQGDFSVLVMDKFGKVVYSTLTSTVANAELLLTTPRNTMDRSARAPDSFNLDLILESGFYAWNNLGTSSLPAECVDGDAFMLQVESTVDMGRAIYQRLADLTLSTAADAALVYTRQSVDGGATWSAWARVGNAMALETRTTGKTYGVLYSDRFVVMDNPLAATVSIVAGAVRAGVKMSFAATNVGNVTVQYAASSAVTIVPGQMVELVWTGEAWTLTNVTHGKKIYQGATSTTWVCPPGVTKLLVNAIGQGGKGADAVTNSRGGGGGGSGAWCRDLELTVVPGETYAIELSTTGASSIVGTGVNLQLDKGGDASGATPGAGGVGSGGASNGYAGGTAVTAASGPGGGGGGIGGAGGSGCIALGGSGGGSGGLGFTAKQTSSTVVLPGGPALGGPIGGSGGWAAGDMSSLGGGPGGIGGGGGGGSSFATVATLYPGPGGPGGGGGGGGCSSSASAPGYAGGPPIMVLEW